jgi:hypothetical protein
LTRSIVRLPLRTRLYAAALLLPLVALASATGGQWLRCRVTGAVIEACCCDEGDAAAPQAGPTVATVSEADCCDRVIREVTPPLAELGAQPTTAPRPALAVVPLAGGALAVGEAPPVRVETRRSLAPPTAQQRLITKSTLLI